jgi:putative hydrolase of the HAD superfamily
MASLRAILFDLHGTLAYIREPVSDVEISEYLMERGYEVSPQQLRAAWFYVAMIDYPRYGYSSWDEYFTQIFRRLDVSVDKETLSVIIGKLEKGGYELYHDVEGTLVGVKDLGFKTAIITTVARFMFEDAIRPVEKYIDVIMTGYEAGCDKSNPRMYRKVLDVLDVKAGEALMVGDSIYLDIILPKKLGIKAVLLNRSGRKVECSEADAIIESLDQVLEIVR